MQLTVTMAQPHPPEALEVGDQAPPISPFRWIKGSPIRNFEKGRIYVIEFGATWCKPCAAAIPELSNIADRYKGEATVISVFVMERNHEPATTANPKYVENVERYVQKRIGAIRYHVAVDDPYRRLEERWLTAGNRSGVPHVFVIDKDGKIAWIGSSVQAVPQVIERLKTKDYSIEKAIAENKMSANAAVRFDDNELLLIDGNGGDSHDFLFRSILTKYDGTIRNPYPGYIDSFRWLDDPEFANYKDRLQVVGLSIDKLYYLAYADTLSNDPRFRNSVTYEYPDTVKNPHLKTSYGKFWYEALLEVSDLEPFRWDRISKQNRYNYSLKVPSGLGSARVLQALLKRNLEGYFGYNVTVESRLMPCWKLVTLDKARALDKLKSVQWQGGFDVQGNESSLVIRNGEMRDIIWFLASTYGYGSFDYGKLPKEDQAAFIDETGIRESINFVFDKNWTFQQTREYLNSNGLDVVRSDKTMSVVVIRD